MVIVLPNKRAEIFEVSYKPKDKITLTVDMARIRGIIGYPFYGAGYVLGVEPCSAATIEGLAASIEQEFSRRMEPNLTIKSEIQMVVSEKMFS